MFSLSALLRYGWWEGRNPSSVFHTQWYLDQNPDVQRAAICPLYHYLEHGIEEDRRPNALFSARWYLSRYPEISTQHLHPLAHYEQLGTAEGCDPHPYFNTVWLRALPEVMQSKHPNALAAYFAGELNHCRLTPTLDPQWYTKSIAGVARRHEHVPCDLASRRPWERAEQNAEERQRNTQIRAVNLGISQISADKRRTSSTTSIVIGIVGFNASNDRLKRCFSSCINALQNAGFSAKDAVFYLDNSSHPNLQACNYGVTHLKTHGNIGYGAGHNTIIAEAFKASGASHYLALHSDMVLAPRCLVALEEMSRACKGHALIEAIHFPDEHPKIYDAVAFDTPWVSAACLLIPRRILDVLRGFDPDFFMYCEDVDFSWQARAAGFETKSCPRALVYRSTRQRTHCPLQHQRRLESGYILAKKWDNQAFMQLTRQRHQVLYPDAENPPWARNIHTRRAPSTGIADFEHFFHFAEVRW